MDTIRITDQVIHDTAVGDAFRDLIYGGTFSSHYGERQQEVMRDNSQQAYLGVLDFLSATFPKSKSNTAQQPSRGTYGVRLGAEHYFTLSKAAWDILKDSLAIIAAFSSIVAGEISTGGLAAVITVRELVNTLLSNTHKLDPVERAIVNYTLTHYTQQGRYPSTRSIMDHVKVTLGIPEDQVAGVIVKLLSDGVLTVKDEKEQTLALKL